MRQILPPPGWEQHGQTLVREFQFRDFDDGMRLMDRIATGAVDYGRRPDMSIALNRVRLEISNLHHHELTPAELRLASKVNAVLATGAGPARILQLTRLASRSGPTETPARAGP